MSYNSHTGYHGSSATPSNSNNGSYAYGRDPNGRGYQSQLNNATNAQQVNYNSPSYNYSNAPSYADNSNIATGSGAWRQDSQSDNYGYQRNNAYTNQETSVGETYSSGSYTRANTGQSAPQNHAHRLTNLAYASELDSADSRSGNAQITQRYENSYQPSYPQQEQMRSPTQAQSRYALNPPPVATSYPMQTQNSSSSTSSQQQAINAAAALAGAVNRRYPPTGHSSTTSLNNTLAGPGASFNTPKQSQRTGSPQVNTSNGQQPVARNQHGASQMSSTPRTRNVSREPQPTPRTEQNLHRTNAQPASSNTRKPQQSVNSITSILSNTQNVEQESGNNGGVTENVPTFIDPARVFNPYHREHEMKRLQAEAEAKRKAEEEAKLEELRQQREATEAEARKKAEEEVRLDEARKKKEKAEQDAQQRQAKARVGKKNTKGNGQVKAPDPTPADGTTNNPDLDEQAIMAAEMKAMMEKMKAFRSRDPAFFQKMWEDIRKPATNTGAVAVQSPSPQLVVQSLPPTQAAVNQQHSFPSVQPPSTVSSTNAQNQLPPGSPETTSAGQSAAKNGYKVVVENNPEGLPDLGRFPAERRIRAATYNRRMKPNVVSMSGTSEEAIGELVSSSIAASDGSPVPPASATPAALSNMFPPAVGDSEQNAGGAKPGNKQNSGTLWPVEKRTALINTALKVLKANPENASVDLTEAEFHEMLSSNPSYIGLCEMLEKKGLRFHRNVFARDLLNSVPELESAASKSKTNPANIKQAQPTGPIPPIPGPSSTQPPYPPAPQIQYPPIPYGPNYGPNQGYYTHAHPPPPRATYPVQATPMTFVGHPVHMQPQPPGPGYMPFQTPPGAPSRPQPVPGSKEAAARKRDFSELIDLTELGDNEDYVMPNKHPRLDEPDSDTEMETNPFKAFQTPNNAQKNPTHVTATDQYGRPLPPQFNPRSNVLAGSNLAKPDSAPDPGSRMLLAKPLDRTQTPTRMYYDPKTVARDILIATGRHPSDRPLNVHLAGMLGKYIELDSDVATFDWDEIDPGGPPAPKVDLIDLPASKPRFKLGERVRQRRRGPRKLIDKTREPDLDKRANSAAIEVDQSSLSPNPQPLKQLQNKFKSNEQKPSLLRHSLLASEQDGLATPSLHDPTLLSSSPKSSSTPNAKGRTSDQSMETPQIRKRGRPPGSKNKFPTVAGLKEQAIKVNVPRRDESATTPLPKEKDKFKCKWKKCNASLINLDTLRKHIGKVHRPTTEQITKEGYTCWWKRCRHLAQDEEGSWVTTKVFDDWEEWLSHIEKDHVSPIAMKFGDGPATHHIDPLEIQQERQKYLSTIEVRADGTEHMVETTPLISAEHNASHPPDVLNLTRVHPDTTETVREEAEVEALRYFMLAHKIKRKSREASEEFIRAMQKRREKIGPGIDRGGCTLITEDMRDTFVQNPAIRRVIKDDA